MTSVRVIVAFLISFLLHLFCVAANTKNLYNICTTANVVQLLCKCFVYREDIQSVTFYPLFYHGMDVRSSIFKSIWHKIGFKLVCGLRRWSWHSGKNSWSPDLFPANGRSMLSQCLRHCPSIGSASLGYLAAWHSSTGSARKTCASCRHCRGDH